MIECLPCSTRFCTRRTDVLCNISGRNDELCFAYSIVWNKYDLEIVRRVRIGIHDLAHIMDEFNHILCMVVGGSGLHINCIYSHKTYFKPYLSSKDDCTWNNHFSFLLRQSLDPAIAIDTVQNIHQLSLIFVDSFHHHIK